MSGETDWKQLAMGLSDVLLKVLSTAQMYGDIYSPTLSDEMGKTAWRNFLQVLEHGESLIDEVDYNREIEG